MKFYELAYACRVYRGQFDRSYRDMRNALGDNPNLLSRREQDALMRFLNDWGCRIPEKNFSHLKERLEKWALLWISRLPEVGRDIRSLGDVERAEIGLAYGELVSIGSGLHFQDTAAAKTLHALRFRTLPMWDAEIKYWFRKRNGLTRTSAQTYSDFLRYVAAQITDLELDATRLGYCLSDVLKLIPSCGDSLVKLVDEYHWVTITDGHVIPTQHDLEQWLGWFPREGS